MISSINTEYILQINNSQICDFWLELQLTSISSTNIQELPIIAIAWNCKKYFLINFNLYIFLMNAQCCQLTLYFYFCTSTACTACTTSQLYICTFFVFIFKSLTDIIHLRNWKYHMNLQWMTVCWTSESYLTIELSLPHKNWFH